MNALDEAKQLLRDVTPLKTDCGALCGCACCHGSDQDGMILLPGEAEAYTDAAWCRVTEIVHGNLLVCNGTCPRSQRPFACMLFPLRIEVQEKRARIITDPLARSICPLADEDLAAFDRAFVDRAKSAARILLKEDLYRSFFEEQTRFVRKSLDDPLFQL